MNARFIPKHFVECLRYVPFYRRADSVVLGEYPIIGKHEYRRMYSDFVSTRIPASLRERILEFANQSNNIPSRQCRETMIETVSMERSSGTTGPCVWYPKTKAERMVLAIEVARARRQLFPSYDNRRFVDLNTWFAKAELRSALNDRSKLRDAYQDLYERGHRHIYGHASLLNDHADFLCQSNQSVAFSSVESAGEYVSTSQRATITAAFGSTFINQYGTREVWAIGYEIEEPGVFALLKNNIVEVVDDYGRVIDGPGQIGNIVVTSLVCEAFPIVRFRTGDLGSWCERDGVWAIKLQPDRAEMMLATRQGRHISGANYFKEVFNRAISNNCCAFVDPWKVRHKPPVLEIFVSARDMASIPMVLPEVFKSFYEIGECQVQIFMWEGWREGEKRVPYLRLQD